jgi:hypothetical protein
MNLASVVREFHRRDTVLARAAALMAFGFAACAVIAPFDARLILGINPWIKPMKFFLSVSIFLATMAWFMGEADPRHARRLALVRWTLTLMMVGELAFIAMQAARGTTSHYNNRSVFDGIVFGLMGLMITINTAAVAAFIGALRREIPSSRAGYLWGVRLGLATFVVGSLLGFVMVANNAHSVPRPDGGPGLPFVNWSTTVGDLRIAHFIGLHSLQALPLAGFLLDRSTAATPGARRGVVSAAALAWMAVVALALVQALRGHPLIGL